MYSTQVRVFTQERVFACRLDQVKVFHVGQGLSFTSLTGEHSREQKVLPVCSGLLFLSAFIRFSIRFYFQIVFNIFSVFLLLLSESFLAELFPLTLGRVLVFRRVAYPQDQAYSFSYSCTHDIHCYTAVGILLGRMLRACTRQKQTGVRPVLPFHFFAVLLNAG